MRCSLSKLTLSAICTAAILSAPAAMADAQKALQIYAKTLSAFEAACLHDKPTLSKVRRVARAFGVKKFALKPQFENVNHSGIHYGYSEDIPKSSLGYHIPSEGQYAFMFSKDSKYTHPICLVSTSLRGIEDHRAMLVETYAARMEKLFPGQIEIFGKTDHTIHFRVRAENGFDLFEMRARDLSRQLVFQRYGW